MSTLPRSEKNMAIAKSDGNPFATKIDADDALDEINTELEKEKNVVGVLEDGKDEALEQKEKLETKPKPKEPELEIWLPTPQTEQEQQQREQQQQQERERQEQQQREQQQQQERERQEQPQFTSEQKLNAAQNFYNEPTTTNEVELTNNGWKKAVPIITFDDGRKIYALASNKALIESYFLQGDFNDLIDKCDLALVDSSGNVTHSQRTNLVAAKDLKDDRYEKVGYRYDNERQTKGGLSISQSNNSIIQALEDYQTSLDPNVITSPTDRNPPNMTGEQRKGNPR